MLSNRLKLQVAKQFLKARLGRPAFCWLQLFVTRRCNMNCAFCGAKDQTVPDPSLTELKSRVNIAKQLGFFGIAIMGGEPTLRADLVEFIEYAVAQGMYVQLSTNMKGVGPDRLMAFDQAGLGELRFSISLENLYENSWQTGNVKPWEIFQLLIFARHYFFQTAATLVLDQSCGLDGDSLAFRKIACTLAHHNVPLTAVIVEPPQIKWNETISHTYPEFLEENMWYFATEAENLHNEGFDLTLPQAYYDQLEDYYNGRASWTCKAGINTLTVDTSGAVAPCSSLGVYTYPFEKLLEKKYLESLRFMTKRAKKWCSKRCLSGCQFGTQYYLSHARELVKKQLFR